MKISTFVSFCFLTFVNLQSSHGYVASPQQYGRTFDLFNLFPLVDNSYATLSSRISTLESSSSSANSQISQLLNLVQSMSFGIQSLQTQLAAATTTAKAALAAATATPTPKCNSAATALGAQLVAGLCVSVEGGTTASPNLNYNSAKLDCLAKNGKLAEPPFTLTTFYDDLFSNAVLQPKITALTDKGMHVGIESTTTAYAYKTSGATIAIPSTPNNVWSTDPAAPTAAGVPTFIATPHAASTLKWLTGAGDPLATRGYICQYPVV